MAAWNFLSVEPEVNLQPARSTGHFGGCCDRLTIQTRSAVTMKFVLGTSVELRRVDSDLQILLLNQLSRISLASKSSDI